MQLGGTPRVVLASSNELADIFCEGPKRVCLLVRGCSDEARGILSETNVRDFFPCSRFRNSVGGHLLFVVVDWILFSALSKSKGNFTPVRLCQLAN